MSAITEFLLSHTPVYSVEMGLNKMRIACGELNTPEPVIKHFNSCISSSSIMKIESGNYKVNEEQFEQSIQKLQTNKVLTEKNVSLVLPDAFFSFGQLSVPIASLKGGLRPVLEREVQAVNNRPFEDFVIKYEIGEKSDGKVLVHYCTAIKENLYELFSLFKKTGFVPVSAQPAFTGLAKILQMQQSSDSNHPSVFLHFDYDSTTMGIYDSSGLKMVRGIDVGINTLLERLKLQLKLGENEADFLLYQEPLILDDPSDSEAQMEIASFKAIEPVMADFLQKIYGILLLYSSESKKDSGYMKIVISGIGALIKNLDKLIAFNLGISTFTISRELSKWSNLAIKNESLETLAPLFGNIFLKPHLSNRFDRIISS